MKQKYCTLSTLARMANLRFEGRGAHSALADTQVLGGILTKLLWPREADEAANPAPVQVRAAPKKAAKPKAAVGKAKSSASTPNVPSSPTIALPEGFTPFSPQNDARIRRYDHEDLQALITARGKRWTPEEESQLVHSYLDTQQDLVSIVAAHGRSPAALFLKLEALGVVREHAYQMANR